MNLCQASRNILACPYAKSHVQSNLTNPGLWDHATVRVSESLYCYPMAVDHVFSHLLPAGSSFLQNRASRHKGKKKKRKKETNFEVLAAKAQVRAWDEAVG